jgi:hypothetical protein
MYGPSSYGLFNGGGSNATSAGVKFQVDSGTTAAARTDYKIQTAFGTAPESDMFAVGWGSYAAGTVVIISAELSQLEVRGPSMRLFCFI